nr:hypothetical protein [Tanacetum cinerariifolium]
MDAATVLASGAAEVPTGSGSIPTAGPFAAEVPTTSPAFSTATMVTPYRRRRKGKEVMVESKTPKKQKVQEQIDAQVSRELEEQLERGSENEVEINRLKERVKFLEDKEGVIGDKSGYNAPIKGKSNNEGEAAAEHISNDSEEIVRVLTSMDAATVLAGETNVPTGSGFIPTAGPPTTVISTGSEVGPTASLIVSRRKGKEVMVESDTLKKKKLQEQIDA